MSLSTADPSPDLLITTERGIQYWESIDADENGMLGGVPTFMPSVSRIDLQGSRTLLATLGISSKSDQKVLSRVLEGGAGIGRITQALLIPLAEQVDIIEPIEKFTKQLEGKPGVGEIYNTGLAEWRPAQGVVYDLIWIQWCAGHLNDKDLIESLKRCKTVLKPESGLILIKENTSISGADEFDELDGSVTREDTKFRHIFSQAGLDIVRADLQRGFPIVRGQQLLPQKMYALRPQKTDTS